MASVGSPGGRGVSASSWVSASLSAARATSYRFTSARPTPNECARPRTAITEMTAAVRASMSEKPRWFSMLGDTLPGSSVEPPRASRRTRSDGGRAGLLLEPDGSSGPGVSEPHEALGGGPVLVALALCFHDETAPRGLLDADVPVHERIRQVAIERLALRVRPERRLREVRAIELVIRLLGGDDRADRALGFGVLRVPHVVHVKRHGDRGQDRHDHDHDHELHQREALRLPVHPANPPRG